MRLALHGNTGWSELQNDRPGADIRQMAVRETASRSEQPVVALVCSRAHCDWHRLRQLDCRRFGGSTKKPVLPKRKTLGIRATSAPLRRLILARTTLRD